MANTIDATGITTSTRAELVTYFTTQFQAIYGADINLDSDSPDGQLMNIFIQSVLDLEDLLVQVNNMFDPDSAIGVLLDQRVAINGIQRQAGTYTLTDVTVITSQALNLYGLDQTVQQVYTVSDNAGNQWELLTTQTIAVSGTYILQFRAATPGANLTTPNTITTQVTTVLGVTSVNNPTIYTSLGLNEETDAQLKVRRQKSVSLSSQGYLAGLLAALENINGVTSAFVYENNTDATDVDGVPSHSIWVIVAGTAAAVDIATAIYQKRNAGAGMFGNESYTITQVDGSFFVVNWDDVTTQNLFIQFTASSIDGNNDPNIAGIVDQLPDIFTPGVFQEVDINHLATNVQSIDSNTLVTNAGFSTGQTQTLTLSGVAASGTFVVSYNGHNSAAINWNDNIATIQTKVQAVTGLSTALVTGSIASQSLVFNLTAIDSVLALIYTKTNSLMTSAPAAITFTYGNNYANVLVPSSKDKQFTIDGDNIVVLPMILSPSTATVLTSATKQFNGYGGYGTKVYSFVSNNSGGTIGASSGLYTAGVTPSVTDTIKVIDVLGHSATAIITVL